MKLIYSLIDRVYSMQSPDSFGRNNSAICMSVIKKISALHYAASGSARSIVKVLVLLLLLPFLSGNVLAQHDFKLYSDGYTFEKLDKNYVILKVFLTAYEIGSIASWNDDISDFRLSYTADLEESKAVAYTPELKISEIGTEPLLMSLSFIIPKNAQNVYLKFPQKYGGLKTKIFSQSYNAQQSSLHNEIILMRSLSGCQDHKVLNQRTSMGDNETCYSSLNYKHGKGTFNEQQLTIFINSYERI